MEGNKDQKKTVEEDLLDQALEDFEDEEKLNLTTDDKDKNGII